MMRLWTLLLVALVSLAVLPASALADGLEVVDVSVAPTVTIYHDPLFNRTSVSIMFEENTGPLRSFQKEGPWEPTPEDPGEPPAYGGGGEGGWPAF